MIGKILNHRADMNGTPETPRILTNMAFWQSAEWVRQTTSIYPMAGATADPTPHTPWLEAFMLFRQRHRFDVVLTMGARASLAYGLLCLITGADSKQILTEFFIDAHRRGHPLWHLKHAVYRAIARRSIGILTNSSTEVDTNAERLDLPRNRLRFVPLNTNIANPRRSEANDGFVLSAGRTLRDYATLLRAAPNIASPITIVCGWHDLLDAQVSPNVTILYEVTRELYLDQLRRCTLVALPLLPTERSTGQVVMLEAMALGKPVVTTRSPGTIDYLRDGESGRLVPAGNADVLATAINELLARPDVAQTLADRAREDAATRFSINTHTTNKLNAIRELWALRGRGSATP